jgi:hypothetical protein
MPVESSSIGGVWLPSQRSPACFRRAGPPWPGYTDAMTFVVGCCIHGASPEKEVVWFAPCSAQLLSSRWRQHARQCMQRAWPVRNGNKSGSWRAGADPGWSTRGGLNNEGLDLKLLINGGLEAKLQYFTGKIKLPGGLQPGPWIRHWSRSPQ